MDETSNPRRDLLATTSLRVVVRATPTRVWQVLTQSALPARFAFGLDVVSTWQQDAVVTMTAAGAGGPVPVAAGRVVVAQPRRMLLHTVTDAGTDPPARDVDCWLGWAITPLDVEDGSLTEVTVMLTAFRVAVESTDRPHAADGPDQQLAVDLPAPGAHQPGQP